MNILRVVDTFLPSHCLPARQAWQISNRLEQRGIRSPIVSTLPRPPGETLRRDTLDRVRVTRVPVQCSLGPYHVSFGMITYMRRYQIMHAHLYRTFQTDCAFFLRGGGAGPLC